jgi:hypothetical protein
MNSNPDDATIAALAEALENVLNPHLRRQSCCRRRKLPTACLAISRALFTANETQRRSGSRGSGSPATASESRRREKRGRRQ